MKKIVLTLFVLLMIAVGAVNAQNAEYKKQQAIYKRALTYSDYAVARMALFNMMELKPNNAGLLDTLALIYFDTKTYLSSAIVSQEAVKRNPNNKLALEVAGVSFENLGLADKALENFEALYLKDPNINILYKMSFLQYRMKRYNDAGASADIIIADPKSKDQLLAFGKKDNTQQSVPLSAAAYRIKGLIAYDKKEKANAILFFKKALEISPDFEVVAESVKQLEKG